MSKFDRKKAKEALVKRTEESNVRREGDSSTRYLRTDIFFPQWNAKPTKSEPHIIDIIPYIAGKNHTKTDKRNPTKEGDYTYWLEVYAHQNIGPGKEWIVCPARNYGKPCPICENIEERIKEGEEWDDYKDIGLKRRCVYNIVCYDGKEEAKGVQVWEVSYKFGEGPIQLAAKNPRGGGVVPFSDPDIGQSISFEVANDTYNTHQGHKLIERKYVIPDEILNSAFVLDDLLYLRTYEDIHQVFYGEDPIKEKVQEEDVKDPEIPIERQRRQKPIDQPKDTCPAGGTFGEDIDKLENCATCKTHYNECAAKADEIEKERREKREQRMGKGGVNRR